MTVTIHAGVHRTGTTTIQRMLKLNAVQLANNGIIYPLAGTFGGRKLQNSHQPIAWSLFHRTSSGADLLSFLNSSRRGTNSKFVLSGEDFSIHRSVEWLRPLRSQYDVRVIFYLRRQDHWLMSWYNQHVKWPFHRKKSTMSPQQFLDCLSDFYWMDYQKLLSLWEGMLGKEAVTVRVVEPGGVQDTAADFLKYLKIDPAQLPLQPKRDNDSLPIQALEIARHFGLFDMSSAERQRLLRAFREVLTKGAVANTVYSPSERRAILAQFQASNSAVARRYFLRDDLFMEGAPHDDEEYFSFPELSQDQLLKEWIGPIIKHLASGGAPSQNDRV